MAGIAASELAPERRVVPAPEAGEVLGHLHGTLVRCEQVEDQRHPAAGERRPLTEPEEILKAGRDPRWLAGEVVDLDRAASGERDPLRKLAGENPGRLGWERTEQLCRRVRV